MKGHSSTWVMPKVVQFAIVILGFTLLVGLLHQGRFATSDYEVIRQNEIWSNLLKLETQPHCSVDIESLQAIDLQSVMSRTMNMTDDELAKFYSIRPGGSWAPALCQAPFRVFLIIPFRKRDHHLQHFLRLIHPFLQFQNISYTIMVAEQTEGNHFNRAKLFNVGYHELKKIHGSLGCLIFHDVDLLPLDARIIYGCVNGSRALHLSAHLENFRFNLPYAGLVGGAVAVEESIFEDVNGFSNDFFGWGGEDDEFARRLHGSGYSVVRYEPSISRYSMLRHKKESAAFEPTTARSVVEADEQKEAADVVDGEELNGVRQTEYVLVSSELRALYSHILVKL